MFAGTERKALKKYTQKIKAPVYEPKNRQPHNLECYDATKKNRLIAEINNSSLSDSDKEFLRTAATRHIVFNYEKIADYYAHASAEMQDLMEKSALVIIDFDKAIEEGFVNICTHIEDQFLEEYSEYEK